MELSDKRFQQNMMASFIQIAAVTMIVLWCLSIMRPFINLVLWAMIISVALYPAHLSLSAKMGGRAKTSATVFVLIGLTILLVPSWLLAESSITGLKTLATGLSDGTIEVKPPAESVRDWPLIGSSVFEIWTSAARNLETTLNEFAPQLRNAGQWAVSFAGSMATGMLGMAASIIIAGAFLVSADGAYRVSRSIGHTLSEKGGKDMVDMSIATIRSVAKGVLGVAIIQAILSGIGLVLMDVPAAGLWAGAILMLAIMQLPPLILLGPIAVWVFSVADPVPATIFAIYSLIVSISDGFLKPMLLGRGLDIPMLVILIGAIGGAFTSGIIGLFVGAVVLAVGYKLLVAWMVSEEEAEAEPVSDPG